MQKWSIFSIIRHISSKSSCYGIWTTNLPFYISLPCGRFAVNSLGPSEQRGRGVIAAPPPSQISAKYFFLQKALNYYLSHPNFYNFLRPWKHQHKNPLTKSKIIPWQSRIFQIICHHPFLKIKLTYIYFTNFWSVLIFFKRGGLKSEQWKFYTKNVWYYDM